VGGQLGCRFRSCSGGHPRRPRLRSWGRGLTGENACSRPVRRHPASGKANFITGVGSPRRRNREAADSEGRHNRVTKCTAVRQVKGGHRIGKSHAVDTVRAVLITTGLVVGGWASGQSAPSRLDGGSGEAQAAG